MDYSPDQKDYCVRGGTTAGEHYANQFLGDLQVIELST